MYTGQMVDELTAMVEVAERHAQVLAAEESHELEMAAIAWKMQEREALAGVA
jgi:hypothetical protein